MSKGMKIFLKILYYVFTFGLGIIIAVVLPNIYSYEMMVTKIEDSLNKGEYSDAMRLIGGYYDEEYAYHQNFDDTSGVVIFRAATLGIEEDEDDEEESERYTLSYVYSVFLYNVKDKYLVNRKDNNMTKATIVDQYGAEQRLEILNYDSNGDGELDTINTLNNFSYIYFEIKESRVKEFSNLQLYDREGKLYKTIDINLSFNHLFYESLDDFKEEYNSLNASQEKLEQYYEEFIKVDDSYKMGHANDIQKEANKKSVIFVLIYFIWIYILGDLLVGKRYIIKFFKWIISKFRKTKNEEKEYNSSISTDYYCQLIYKLIVPEDCEVNVSINYHNENNQIEMILSKDNNYTFKQRIKAGTYVNAWLECPGYEAINLPKTLNVKGYKMLVDVELQKTDANEKNLNIDKLEDSNENQN